MEEIWKTYFEVKNVKWEVSNFGNLRKNGLPYQCTHISNGYLQFGQGKVHRAVAKLFVDNPNNYKEIDHIDGNRQNNRADNLRWCTHTENMNNPITKKRLSDALIGHTVDEHTIEVLKSRKGELHHMYGIKQSEEWKKKKALAITGEKNGMYGRHHTDETKEKIRQVLKGKHWKLDPITNKRIYF